MQRFLVRIICCFIPNRNLRRLVRKCKFGHYKISGKNNVIYFDKIVVPRWLVIAGLKITINGNNNKIHIGKNCRFINSTFVIGNNDTEIKISDNCLLQGIFARLSYGENQQLTIGENSIMYGANIILDENSSIKIGSDCLFANNVSIWGADGHSVIDKQTQEIINCVSGPLIIGNKCWIGQGVRILKKAHIPSNTIIGGGSVVGRRFLTEYTVIAGNPAQVIRENVTWDIRNPIFLKKHIKENKNEK